MDRSSKTVEVMFALVRLGLWGGGACNPFGEDGPHTDAGGCPIPDGFSWDAAIAEAERQGVSGLFCEGAKSLPPDRMPDGQTRIRLLLECDALEKRSKLVEETAGNLMDRFHSAGLSPIMQKGPSIAMYYPKPLLRKSGDIDLYFPPEEFSKARKTAEEFSPALSIESEPDGSLCYRYDNVTVEHHNHFFDSRAQFENLRPDTKEAAVILQITHILKHAMGPGIGLKQLCDYAVATRRLLPECDIRMIAESLRKAGLKRWLGRLDAFVCQYLGVPQDELLSTKAGIRRLSPAPLLHIVLQGGEFGHHNPFRTLMASPRRRKLNTLRFFLQRLPFAISTAPAEWWHTFSSLVKGNLTH